MHKITKLTKANQTRDTWSRPLTHSLSLALSLSICLILIYRTIWEYKQYSTLGQIPTHLHNKSKITLIAIWRWHLLLGGPSLCTLIEHTHWALNVPPVLSEWIYVKILWNSIVNTVFNDDMNFLPNVSLQCRLNGKKMQKKTEDREGEWSKKQKTKSHSLN